MRLAYRSSEDQTIRIRHPSREGTVHPGMGSVIAGPGCMPISLTASGRPAPSHPRSLRAGDTDNYGSDS
ncbi:protein of unknown function [Modestobacter italicus]|uniref:Uncharacterized protein n=1 Tax=Modestobacter italicus (strain DSM 44449 / CECT 9708 / BC 501) TaxID=2732864 RepID=I4ER83_MODI5|nr:protein of unknown function [Modestobacter marinus]